MGEVGPKADDRGELERAIRRCALLLRRAHLSGREAYGELDLPLDVFAHRVVDLTLRRLQASDPTPSERRIARVVSKAAGADLFLAVACEEGTSGAWDVLEVRYRPRLRGLARKHGASVDEAEELVQELPGLLATPPPRGVARTRLGTYDGSGSLFCWLGVIVLRRLADRRRASARSPLVELSENDRPKAANGNPADQAADREEAARLREALARAWKGLTPKESVTLMLKYRDGLAQNEIAVLLGVGKSRVSHIVRRALEKLRHTVTRRVRAELPEGGFHAAFRAAVEEHMSTLADPDDQLS